MCLSLLGVHAWPDVSLSLQHNALVSRMDQLEAEAGEDARMLARLWQLQNKMESVGSGASYGGELPDLSSPILHLSKKAVAFILANPGLPRPAPSDFSLCDGRHDDNCVQPCPGMHRHMQNTACANL